MVIQNQLTVGDMRVRVMAFAERHGIVILAKDDERGHAHRLKLRREVNFISIRQV